METRHSLHYDILLCIMYFLLLCSLHCINIHTYTLVCSKRSSITYLILLEACSPHSLTTEGKQFFGQEQTEHIDICMIQNEGFVIEG